MGLIVYIKNRYRQWQHQRFLKKQGWTEQQYQHYTDPRVDRQSTQVDQYYCGYSYKHVFETSKSGAFGRYSLWTECYGDMQSWCKQNCELPWRTDILRVTHNLECKTYEINELSSRDAVFFVFCSERDYLGFLLKWS